MQFGVFRRIYTAFCLCAIAAVFTGPLGAQSYDLSRDFSLASNPNGVWSYGWEESLGGSFTPFTFSKTSLSENGVPLQLWQVPDTTPVVLHNATSSTATTDGGQGNFAPGTTWFYPGSGGPQNYGVIRFTVPIGRAGAYYLAAAVRPAYNGAIQGDTDFHVLTNGVEVFGQALAAGASANYSNNLVLAVGDTIDFAIGRGADNNYNGSGLKIEATLDLASTNPVPPSSYVVVPNSAEHTETAFGSGTLSEVTRAQQVYGAAELPHYPILIHEIRFRPDTFYGRAFSTTVSNIQINFSTSARNPDQLSATFAENVGTDDTVVFQGALAVSSQYSGPPAGPKAFDIIVRLTQPFLYDPARGNLLLDVRNFSGSSASLLGGQGGPDAASRVLGGVNALSGGTDTGADAVQILFSRPADQSFDLSKDFSIAANPNGVWSYGWEGTLGGSFNLLTIGQTLAAPNGVPLQRWSLTPNTAPAVYHNATTNTATSDGGQGVYPPGTAWFYAGENGAPQNFGVIRFTTPAGGEGTYLLKSAVRTHLDGPSSNDNDYHVLKNGVELFGQVIAANGTGGYSNTLGLVAGDTVDFVVGRGPDGSNAGLKIEATLDLASTNPVPPTIVNQPQSQTVTEGTNVTFVVTVSGSSPLSYQWFFNGSSIDGATAASLVLNNVQMSHGGNYVLTVSNVYGAATSQTAVLSVHAAPPPADYDLSRDFALSSNPVGAWSYGWKTTLDGSFTLLTFAKTNIAENGVPIELWALNSFEQPAVLHNATTNTATVAGGQGNYPPGTVWFLPGYEGRAQNYGVIRFIVPMGSGGEYEVNTMVRPAFDGSIQGDTDFHVLKDGVELFARQLAAGASAGYSNRVSLAAGDTIDFAIGRGADNSYLGSALKIAATLDLASTNPVPPTIVSQPQSQTVTEGTNVTFEVTVSGSRPLSYQWFFNETAIDGATAASLVLNNVQLSHAGNYALTVSNAYGAATSQTAVLSVNAAPPPADYDLSRDFSLASNPNGAWSYGWEESLGASFTAFTFSKTSLSDNGVPLQLWQVPNSSPVVLHNATSSTATTDGSQGSFPPGTTWFYPGPGGPENYGVIRFRVPNGGDGNYDLATAVRPAYNGSIQGDTDFHVLKNGAEVFGQALAAGASASYTNHLSLAAGDTIDFVIGRGADNSYHGSGLKIEATLDLVSTNPVPPTIVGQPQSQAVTEGASVILGVAVNGSAPLSYQWRFNGSDISDATNSALLLEYVQVSNAGNYDVVVTNSYGSVTSSVATLTVTSTNVPPTITSNPNGGYVNVGASFTLSVTALGSSPLKYQWYLNGADVPGATNSSLVISNAQPSHGGTYWVTVSNAVGSASSRGALVNVVEPLPGGQVIFANTTNSYVYDVDGTTRVPASTAYLAQLYGGPDSGSLQPVGGAVGFAGPGRFSGGTRTITTVAGGAVASVQVRVWESAYGTTYEQAQAAGGKTGASTVFTVTTGGSGSPPTLPTPLTGLQSFSLMPGAGTTPPAITAQPVSQSVVLGESTTFAVTASGDPPLQYQWRFDGVDLAAAIGASLTLTNANFANAGDYTVVVRNNGGAVTSQVATLTVAAERILAAAHLSGQHEGDLVSVPVTLISQGDVGGMTFILYYNPDFLSSPQVTWGGVLDGALKEVNAGTLGELRFVFAFGGATVPAGTQSLATVSFRARTIQSETTTDLRLQILDVSRSSGDPILYGSTVQAGSVEILPADSPTGDNNGNDRLDVGDATILLRLLTHLDSTRSWDITRNDLNRNGVLDSGDVIKILRAAAGIDPQPAGAPVAASTRIAGSGFLAASPAGGSGSAILYPHQVSGNSGQLVIVQVRLRDISTPVSGASFTLDFPATALRLRSAQDHRAGFMVAPNAAAVWNVAPTQIYSTQNGRITFAASSASPWPANNGVLAELTFEVQAAAGSQYAWPLTLSAVEITPDGFRTEILPSSGNLFIGRDPVRPLLSLPTWTVSGEIEFTISGDSGARYAIEASSDLTTWRAIAEGVAAGVVHVLDENGSPFAHRFYRARLVE